MKQLTLLVLGFIQALLYLPINLSVTLIALVLAPVLPLFASLDGDSGWKNVSKHPYVTTLLSASSMVN